MPSRRQYYAYVPRNKPLTEVLAENVRALMDERGLKQTGVAKNATRAGKPIDQRTVGRVLAGEFPAQVTTLDGLAAGIGVEPWQLLVPNLDPKSLPKPVVPDLTEEQLSQVERVLGELEKLSPAQRDLFVTNDVVADILRRRYFPVEDMRGQWDASHLLQQPPGKYEKGDGKK